MKYNDLINELLNLLDENDEIRKLKELKDKLVKDNSLGEDIKLYQLTKSIDLKKKLFENHDYLEYLTLENNLIFLVQEITSKFNILSDRKCHHESN